MTPNRSRLDLIAAASRADGLRSLPPAAGARRSGGGFFVDFLVCLALLAALALSWHGIAAQLARHHGAGAQHGRVWSGDLADIKAAS